jgi:hypothetical protein
MFRRSLVTWTLALTTALAVACGPDGSLQGQPAASSGGKAGNGSGDIAALMKARNLSEADVSAALKTYTPTGGRD